MVIEKRWEISSNLDDGIAWVMCIYCKVFHEYIWVEFGIWYSMEEDIHEKVNSSDYIILPFSELNENYYDENANALASISWI